MLKKYMLYICMYVTCLYAYMRQNHHHQDYLLLLAGDDDQKNATVVCCAESAGISANEKVFLSIYLSTSFFFSKCHHIICC